mgnify:CR=1 FL=1
MADIRSKQDVAILDELSSNSVGVTSNNSLNANVKEIGGTVQSGANVIDTTNTAIRVVYNCAGNWDNFMNYTSALTSTSDLTIDWKH